MPPHIYGITDQAYQQVLRSKFVCLFVCLLRIYIYLKYSQLRLIEPPVNRFHRLMGSKFPGFIGQNYCLAYNIFG